MVGTCRSGHYYKSRKDDSTFLDVLREKAEEHSSYGFWKLYKRMRKDGLAYNHKKVYHGYKLLNLGMRRKGKKRVPERVKEPLLQPLYANKSWSMDFMSDTLVSGRRFRTLNIIHDYNRESLQIEIATGFPAKRVIRVLEEVVSWRGRPERIRVDNGPEFISLALKEWCRSTGIELQYIQPGKPMQNAYIERFNKTYRNEILDRYLFFDLEEVRALTTNWINDYNENRPHDSLGDMSPREFARRSGALTVDNFHEVIHC